MNTVTPFRGPLMQGQSPWCWDGTRWVMNPAWDDQCGCGPPPCPQPQPQPPSCFSAVAKADACWDQSQALYNLVSKVVSNIFTNNPGIIPAPPPSTGSGPTLGVTDGSVAAPGHVGEVLSNLINGNWSSTVGVAPGAIAVSALTLTPGDWGISYSCAFAGPQDMEGATIDLSQPAQADNMQTTLVTGASTLNMDNIVLTSATTPFNVSVPTLLAFSLYVFASGTTGVVKTGTWSFRIYARRMR